MSSAGHGAARVVELLHANRKTICTAESLTGGELASALVDIAGASAVFAGGVTTYSLEAKRAVLGFSQTELADGAVSAEVATSMAQRVRKLLGRTTHSPRPGLLGQDLTEASLREPCGWDLRPRRLVVQFGSI